MSETHSNLMNAAIRILSTNPSASLSEIAEAAGVQRVTLHRHFGSRKQLLAAITLQSLDDMDEACQLAAQGAKSHTEALQAVVAALVPVGDRFRFLWSQDASPGDQRVQKRERADEAELLELIEGAKAEGGISKDLPNAWILASIEWVVFSALATIEKGQTENNNDAETGELHPEAVGLLAARTLFQGIAPTSGGRKKRSRKKYL